MSLRTTREATGLQPEWSVTWDQQVSRAFAAEFLAPRAALTARIGGRADPSKVEELAGDFGASPMVIEKQLENAGVALIDES